MDYKEIFKRRSKGINFTLCIGIKKGCKIDIRRVFTQFQFEIVNFNECDSFIVYKIVYLGKRESFGTQCVYLGKEIGLLKI